MADDSFIVGHRRYCLLHVGEDNDVWTPKHKQHVKNDRA